MYSFFFYFPIADIRKIIEYAHILNSEFAKIFGIRYDGIAYTDVDKLLELRENVHDEIYQIPKINDTGPHNAVRFWEESFTISVEIGFHILQEINLENDTEKFHKNAQVYAEKIVKLLPILAMDFGDGDEPFEKGWKALQESETKKWIYFGYIRENDELRYIQGENSLY